MSDDSMNPGVGDEPLIQLRVRNVIIAPDPAKPLVILKPDGTIEFGPDYTPTEAARVFWMAMADMNPLLHELEQLRSNKYAALHDPEFEISAEALWQIRCKAQIAAEVNVFALRSRVHRWVYSQLAMAADHLYRLIMDQPHGEVEP